jgi:hypothetical protein
MLPGIIHVMAQPILKANTYSVYFEMVIARGHLKLSMDINVILD